MKNDEFKEYSSKQLDSVIDQYYSRETISTNKEYRVSDEVFHYRLFTEAQAAIERISGSTSTYSEQVKTILAWKLHSANKIEPIMGIISALKADIMSGFLKSTEELIHACVFSDYLEMAEYFLKGEYKDPAAIIAGSTLEVHIRNLCLKYGIDIEEKTSKDIRHKKASEMNQDLYKNKAYNKIDFQNILSWLAIRNDAAHANFNNYTKEQVTDMISGIKEFISRNPA